MLFSSPFCLDATYLCNIPCIVCIYGDVGSSPIPLSRTWRSRFHLITISIIEINGDGLPTTWYHTLYCARWTVCNNSGRWSFQLRLSVCSSENLVVTPSGNVAESSAWNVFRSKYLIVGAGRYLRQQSMMLHCSCKPVEKHEKTPYELPSTARFFTLLQISTPCHIHKPTS